MAANHVIVIHLDRTMTAVLCILDSVFVNLGWAVDDVTAACQIIISSRLMAAEVRLRGRIVNWDVSPAFRSCQTKLLF